MNNFPYKRISRFK